MQAHIAYGSPWFLLIRKTNNTGAEPFFERLSVLTTKIIKDLMDQGRGAFRRLLTCHFSVNRRSRKLSGRLLAERIPGGGIVEQKRHEIMLRTRT